MRAIVTGGAGYIGTALVPMLDDPRVIDDLSVGRTKDLPEGCDFLPTGYEVACYDDCDTVIHLAASVGETPCEKAPRAAILNNVNGLLELLEKLKAQKRPPFLVFASSLVVYGDHPSPFRESTRHEPLNTYAATKCVGEYLVRISGLPHAILRFANVWGLGRICRPGSLTGKFARCVARGEPLPIWGDGSQRVDMVHVRDVAAACWHFAERRIEGTYNIGSGSCISVNDLAEEFLRVGVLMGQAPGQTAFVNRNYQVPHDRCVDNRMACEAGWYCQTMLRAGAEELIRWAAAQELGD